MEAMCRKISHFEKSGIIEIWIPDDKSSGISMVKTP
jgi:hypothetical protein